MGSLTKAVLDCTNSSMISSSSTPKVTKKASNSLDHSISQIRDLMLGQYFDDGYWWYTLEANDTINAESIFLMHYLGVRDEITEASVCRWLLKNQNDDGSWSLFYGGSGDLSSTVECYTALKMAGYELSHPKMTLAREFILTQGSITKIRVFSRIHLALFGLIDWKLCPKMPVALMQFPKWAPVNIYEFSSWARACIVPLLVIMDMKKTHIIPKFNVDELYLNNDPSQAQWRYEHEAGSVSFENLFVQVDKMLQLADQMKLKPLRQDSLKKCERYIREHLRQTEDIYPAMFYGTIALYSLSFTLNDDDIQKALSGLNSFRIKTSHNILPEIPKTIKNHYFSEVYPENSEITSYQQCCISPVWDTAWAGVAMLEAGLSSDDERLKKSAQWLLEKQITDVAGDWSVKNPGVAPGGWSFQFQNKYYPDVDDTIEVLTFLSRVNLPYYELKKPIQKGLDWLLSMQCRNGGFAAFDKDNDLKLLNKLPFSDHGACLDPATVDITGRMIEFLIKICDFAPHSKIIQRSADFIVSEQEKDGSFWGRWGVNYLYGTWCALEGLGSLNRSQDQFVIKRAIHWLNSVQNDDGGFGESCLSYNRNHFIKLEESVPSQTAWALMGYLAVGLEKSQEAARAADFLVNAQQEDGSWNEPHFTGTGFPGHFYLRYHGYRHYFPLLALAKYRNSLKK